MRLGFTSLSFELCKWFIRFSIEKMNNFIDGIKRNFGCNELMLWLTSTNWHHRNLHWEQWFQYHLICMEQGESVNHLFLHCSVTLGLWHRLFQLAKMDWVPPKSISDMMFINYKGFGKSKRGVVLWQNACIALIWVVWWERNAKIFEDKVRNSENLWDSIHFLASYWAFCSVGFKGIPFNVLQLDWLAMCRSNSSNGTA